MFEELVPSRTASHIVGCMEDAFGDEIEADIRRNGFRTFNSSARRSWDILNTNLLNSLDAFDCTPIVANRNWQMIAIYEKTTGCIITLMKETRFAQLRKNQMNRTRMHNLDMFASFFNHDVEPSYHQTSLFHQLFNDTPHEIQMKVQKILQDFCSNIDVVHNHILVLFDVNFYRLVSVRAVKVSPSLDIASNYNYDWSSYISTAPSTVTETIVNPDSRNNNPSGKITLSEKALARRKTDLEYKAMDSSKTDAGKE